MATLRINDLHKSYGSVRAVDGLSLAIDDGEFFVLIGPSGAGKTTTLKSVAGLHELDAGTIEIGGQDVTDVEPYHRNIAMAFESYALYPQQTVFDNLASPLRSGRSGVYSKEEITRQVDSVARTLGLDPLLRRYPRELSNGQRQRVSLGRVLVRPAGIYLLDEPLAHLDAKLRAEMRVELKSFGELSHTTSLYVTHDYQEAVALGDRIGVVNKGKLLQVGTPSEVWNAPVDTFVARMLGEPGMNLFDAEVEDGHAVAVGGAIRVPLATGLPIHTGDRLRIGVRPRDIGGTSETARYDKRVQLQGRVELVERLGREVELTLRIGDQQLVMVGSSADSLPEGTEITVGLSLSHVHLFAAPESDGADSARLVAPGAPEWAPGAGRESCDAESLEAHS